MFQLKEDSFLSLLLYKCRYHLRDLKFTYMIPWPLPERLNKGGLQFNLLKYIVSAFLNSDYDRKIIT